MANRNPITLEVLDMLDAIDRRGSFAKAAEELNKATSALSYAVQKLEEQLDIPLFQRQGRRSVLTPAGQLVLEEGRLILQASTRLARQAREVATGWETRIRIALESITAPEPFFSAITRFLHEFPSIEIDINECVLNGGWEALEHNRTDLLVGGPGPVPQQKGFRAIRLSNIDLIPVIASSHPLAAIAGDRDALSSRMHEMHRVVTHDTSQLGITRSEGLSSDGRMLYVQNIDQKIHAIAAGAGIGNLPRSRVQSQLESGELVQLNIETSNSHGHFLAWRISNKGRGLQSLVRLLSEEAGE
ncbi:MAG: LysR substrate-binding domain-containing protein [Halioglobus sp.]